MLKVLRFISLQIIVLALVYGTSLFIMEGFDESFMLAPNMSVEDPNNLLLGLSEDYTLPIIENSIVELENYPMFLDGVVYVPVEMVEQYFNDDFYWDDIEKVLTFTSLTDVIRMKTDELTYIVNDEPLTLNIPIRELSEGVPYMPLELVKKFSHFSFYHDIAMDTLIIEDLSKDGYYSKVEPLTNGYSVIRTWKDRKSSVVKKISAGDELKIYEDDGIWTKVRTKEGLTGYIKNADLGSVITVAGTEPIREIYDYSTRMTFEGGLNLGWHQVYSFSANKKLDDRLEGVHGLDVVSPFWFRFENSEGDISNIADIDYVRKLHDMGIQVWPMLTNNFDKQMTHDVLSSTSKREKVIKEVLAFAALYELDGINVDFENVAKEDGVYFVQFMKELTPYLKQQGLVVSVDMYVPRPWTAHYGREEVGEIVDYVMVMAYDEHWSTSPTAGSVASIGFVEDGIVQTLEEVPSNKVVLGLPYYTRLWFEEEVDGVIQVSSEAMGMNRAYDTVTGNGATFEWIDDDIKQYYAEYEADGGTYKMWLEDERSIEEKVKLVEKYDLAGVSGWSLVFPKSEIWDILDAYLKE